MPSKNPNLEKFYLLMRVADSYPNTLGDPVRISELPLNIEVYKDLLYWEDMFQKTCSKNSYNITGGAGVYLYEHFVRDIVKNNMKILPNNIPAEHVLKLQGIVTKFKLSEDICIK